MRIFTSRRDPTARIITPREPFQMMGVSGVGAIRYDFTNVDESFTVQNATLTVGPTSARIQATAIDSRLIRNVSLNGAAHRYAKMRFKEVAAFAQWEGTFYWSTAAHGSSGSYAVVGLAFPPADVGGWRVAQFDLFFPSFGGTDWRDNIITTIRFDLVNGATDAYDVDWIELSNRPYVG